MNGLVYLEYVESGGSQYVMTDIVPSSGNFGFIAEYMCVDNSGSKWALFGARTRSGANDYQLTAYDGGVVRQGASTPLYRMPMTVGMRETVSLVDGTLTKADGTTVQVDLAGTTAPCPIAVFGLNENGAVVQGGAFRLYYLALLDDGVFRVFVPAALNGVAGLYDVANDTFLAPHGTLASGPESGGGASMPSEVTLPLNEAAAWQAGLTFQQAAPAGTAIDAMAYRNYPKRAGTVNVVETFGLDATIEFSDGYQVYIAAYDENLDYLGYNAAGSSMGWKSSPYTFSSSSAEYIWIAVKSLPEAEFTDAMFEDMAMSVTLAGGGGSMTDACTREEAYDLNVIAGWGAFAYGNGKYSESQFRNAGSGNGARTWGLSEDNLPMGATGYMRIDTANATNADNTIAQDAVPLVAGEVYTIGAFVRGRGFFTCGPTQDGYYRCGNVYVDHPNWRFYGGTFTAKSAGQNMYWRNETIGTDDYAGALEICAPLLVRGGVAPVIIATDSCTLAVVVDVQKVETYYYQTTSTGSAPNRPTTASPSGWQATEFAFDASKAVWACQKTTLTDGTFYWGEVSKSSAYEGSVVAKNAADAAQTTANTANDRAVACRGVCSTAAGTAAKVVASANFALAQGATVTVHNTTAQTVAGAITLNVNSTGAKAVYVAGAATSDTNRLLWAANSSITFTYDGTYWRVEDNPGTWYGTACGTAAGTAAKTTAVAEVVLFKGAKVSVPMTYANTAAATLNVSSLGATAVYYGNGATAPTTANGYGWKAGSTCTFAFDGKFWRYEEAQAMKDAAEAAKVAGNYIFDTGGNDVWIHSEGHGPDSSGEATDSTYGWRIGSVFELVRAGLSYLKMWVDGTAAKVRVGLESAGHSVFSPDGMEVYKGGVLIARFGDSATVGKTGAAHTTMDSSGVKVYNADGSLMAQFGSNVVLGSTNGTYAELDSNGLRLKNKYSSYRTDVYAEFGETARIGVENFNHIDLNDASMSLSYGKSENEVKAFSVTTPSEMVEAEQEDGVIVGSWTTPSGSTQWLYYGANYSDTVFNSRGDGTASEPLYAAFYDGTAYRTFSFYLPQSDTASHPTNQIYLVGTVYMWYDADADSLRYGANQTNTALVTIVSRNAGATLTCGRINCGGLKVSGNTETAGHYYAEGLKVGHSWCYMSAMTSTTLGAQSAETKLKVTGIAQCKPEGAFTFASNQVTAHVAGWYDVSVEVSSSSDMSGKLVGVGVKRVRSGSSSDVAGPEYTRMNGSYDRVVLSPTPVYLQVNDVLYLYGRNNSGAGGTIDTVRWMIRPLVG